MMGDEVTRLEEKIAYLERHVVEQDKAMLEFADELARLKREVKAFAGKLASGAGTGPGENDLADERPPHY
jgi:SlyX protein